MRSTRASRALLGAFAPICAVALLCVVVAGAQAIVTKASTRRSYGVSFCTHALSPAQTVAGKPAPQACFARAMLAAVARNSGDTDSDGSSDIDEYTLAISPATVAAGSTTTLTFTFTNNPGNGEAANGAQFQVPAGFQVTGVQLPAGSGGSATVSRTAVLLRNFVDEPGHPMRVKLTVRAPIACGHYSESWGSSGWENDSGFPGGREPLSFVANGSAVTTTVATPCHRSVALAVTPGAVTGGHATAFTLSLKNRSSIGVALSSATVLVPRNLKAARASLSAGEKGSLRLARGVLVIRGLRLAAGGTLKLKLTATAPLDCGTTRYIWRSAALEGRLPVLLAASTRGRTTVVSTHCRLVFSTQPHNATVGVHITGADFNPSGPPVTVEVVDSAGKLVTSSGAAVAVALAKNPGSTSLAGKTSVHAVRGIAKFSGLSLGKPANGYALSAAGKLTAAGNSNAFDEADDGSVCPQNVTCHTTVKSSAASFEVVANPETTEPNAGSLQESLDVGTPLTCAGYTAVDPNWYSFSMTSINRSKELSYTVTEPYPTTGTPLPLAQTAEFCFAAPYEFTTKAGTPAAAETLPDGTSGYVGLLPACPASGPCIEPSTMLPSQWDSLCSLWTGYLWSQLYGCGTATLTIDIPAGLSGDPWGRA